MKTQKKTLLKYGGEKGCLFEFPEGKGGGGVGPQKGNRRSTYQDRSKLLESGRRKKDGEDP